MILFSLECLSTTCIHYVDGPFNFIDRESPVMGYDKCRTKAAMANSLIIRARLT